ncbi:MAG: PAS domain S-box protein [Deltaproteobacteria bacterium]|nr:PAS domain S-box protein [Deltaproteobacteria bacterium]
MPEKPTYEELEERVRELEQETLKRKQAEEALVESEQKYKTLTENSLIGVFIQQEERYEFVNGRFAEMHGYKPDELLGKWSLSLVDPSTREVSRQRIKRKLKGELILERHEIPRLRKDGGRFWCELISTRIEYKGKPAIMGHLIDITDRKQAENAMKESEEKYRRLFEMESDAIFLIENDTGNILEVNAAASSLYGFRREELIKMKNTDLSAEPDRTRKATHGKAKRIPIRYHRKRDGAVFPVEITATHLNWKGREAHIAAIRDISFRLESEKKQARLEAQLRQAHKMEAIGTLAGGIAHDFNNLLMGIQGNASLMLLDVDKNSPYFENLKNIENYVQSGAGLTKQLLGFARGGKYEVKPTNLNELIEKSVEIFGRTRKEINIHTKYQNNLWNVEADQGQIDQVLLNLYVNAWQSMTGGGDLYIETQNMTLHKDYVRPHKVPAGAYVKIGLTDTGAGMDQDTREKIFDPFFTTKEMGRGTGLGLATVYGIIKNHGGIINVYSEKGHGSTFNIYLPATDKEVRIEMEVDNEVLKGNETVFLVDDEDMIIDVGQEMIKKLGYRVFVAKSGSEAIEIYRENKDHIDLVILDMIMPDMSGGETFDQLKLINPEIKVLLSSGYSLNGQAQSILHRGCHGFIQKPFDLKALSQKMREILENK